MGVGLSRELSVLSEHAEQALQLNGRKIYDSVIRVNWAAQARKDAPIGMQFFAGKFFLIWDTDENGNLRS